MDEVENVSSIQEVALPETEATQEVQAQEQSAPAVDQQQDKDWVKRLRRDREDGVRREKELKAQNEMLQQLLTKQPQWSTPQPVEEDLLDTISKQDYVAGETVAKAVKRLESKFEKKFQEQEERHAEKAKINILNDAKREYPDFDQVVNSETLEILEETNPRLAASLAKTMKEDPYSFAIQSYEYIKSKGLSKTSSQIQRANETDKKIEQNKKAVQSPQAFDKRPMAQAFQMTDKMKEELRKEMYGFAQQAGMGY